MHKNLLNILAGDARLSTRWLFGLLLALPALMKIPAVTDFVKPLLTAHPQIAMLVASLIAIGTLLHNPQVLDVLQTQIEPLTTTQSAAAAPVVDDSQKATK